MEQELILRITAPHFVAGVVLRRIAMQWQVTETAPILKYMRGWSPVLITHYTNRKGWPNPHVIVRNL